MIYYYDEVHEKNDGDDDYKDEDDRTIANPLSKSRTSKGKSYFQKLIGLLKKDE